MVRHIYLEGDAEINFEETPSSLDAPAEYGYFHESLMRDNRLSITQPYLHHPKKPRSSFIRRTESDTEPYWSFYHCARVYWSTYSYDARILILEGISQTLSRIREYPEIFGSARLCFSSTQHKKHIERCRCMLWFPLYLLAEKVRSNKFFAPAPHIRYDANNIWDVYDKAGDIVGTIEKCDMPGIRAKYAGNLLFTWRTSYGMQSDRWHKALIVAPTLAECADVILKEAEAANK